MSLFGLMKQAGRLEIGEEPVGTCCKARKAVLLAVADDAAENSVRRANSFAQAGSCPIITLPADKTQLGNALGRGSCAMVALTDVGFAASLMKKLCVLDPGTHDELSATLERKADRVQQRQKEKRSYEKRLARERERPFAVKRKRSE